MLKSSALVLVITPICAPYIDVIVYRIRIYVSIAESRDVRQGRGVIGFAVFGPVYYLAAG